MSEVKTVSPPRHHWRMAVASFLMVLFAMPLGHALMIMMENLLPGGAVRVAGFSMGAVGFAVVVWGVFVRGDTRQTLFGLFGGLLFWTGWYEFLFQYYARRYGVPPEVVDGVVVTKPEYLIMPATFGLWVMVMMLYVFCTPTGCCLISWLQRRLFRGRARQVAARPLVRHVSIVTFMELMVMMWTCYLALMFCYDPNFLGDRHPVTFAFGLFCLGGSVLMFRKLLRVGAWGRSIRMAIATVIVFWTPVEILGRIGLFREFWVEPEQYSVHVGLILALFAALAAYIVVSGRRAGAGGGR